MDTNSEKEKRLSVVKKQLEHLITKINNRCNPENYNSFSELYEYVKTTSTTGVPSFLSPAEVRFIQSNPQIENNILDLCIKQRENDKKNNYFTIGNILDILLFTNNSNDLYNSKMTGFNNPDLGTRFLKDPSSQPIHGTIEEVLVMLDLSIVPYR
jgi:hypothetical protein